MTIVAVKTTSGVSAYRASPNDMHWRIDHENYVVYISTGYLFTELSTKKDHMMWCTIKDFKTTYPHKWQEIQAELALQRLKIS